MPSIRVSQRRDESPDVAVFDSTYGQFIALQFGDDLSVYLAGHDAECASEARRIAAALLAAADKVDALTHLEPANVV